MYIYIIFPHEKKKFIRINFPIENNKIDLFSCTGNFCYIKKNCACDFFSFPEKKIFCFLIVMVFFVFFSCCVLSTIFVMRGEKLFSTSGLFLCICFFFVIGN